MQSLPKLLIASESRELLGIAYEAVTSDNSGQRKYAGQPFFALTAREALWLARSSLDIGLVVWAQLKCDGEDIGLLEAQARPEHNLLKIAVWKVHPLLLQNSQYGLGCNKSETAAVLAQDLRMFIEANLHYVNQCARQGN